MLCQVDIAPNKEVVRSPPPQTSRRKRQLASQENMTNVEVTTQAGIVLLCEFAQINSVHISKGCPTSEGYLYWGWFQQTMN